MPDRTIQKLFKAYADRLDASAQPLKNRKAIHAIQHCRTAEMGSSYYACEDRHQVIEQHHSCRHRSCYLCAQRKRIEWVDKQKVRLLNVPHFHVIFTLPHEYLNIWRYNESLMSDILFRASRDTLIELLEDSRYQGFRPGILMALHTWGRQLSLHPHTHCLVTAGGLNSKGAWQESGEFLLPIRVVKALYRGKCQALIQEAFESGELSLPDDLRGQDFKGLHSAAYRKEWSVRIEERYAHGQGVMLYLSRYLKGGPLNPKQIDVRSTEKANLRYLDHRDKRIKGMELSWQELMNRLLLHVPAIGKHTIRYYGLYAPSAKSAYQNALKQWGNLEGVKPSSTQKREELLFCCQRCGKPARLTFQRWRKGNSIIREYGGEDGFVQQVDQPDIADVGFKDSS